MFACPNIPDYHQALIQGQTTCAETVGHFLDQIEKQQHLNAFVEVYETEAKERAVMLDQKRKSGHPLKALHGVVIAIKDVICYQGHKVGAASGILQDFESLYSATAVQRLLDEDAILIGRCNCDEFAMGSTNENSYYGKVLNALDHSRVPGGSSGGSAVAVQAGLCMVSLGSDTGGSVRQPADFCGIVGLKPTYGRVSRYGLIAYASSFDQIGIFGNTVKDVARVLEVISGPDEFDSTAIESAPASFSQTAGKEKKYHIAYFKTALEHPSLDEEIRNALLELIAKLKQDGHVVEEVPFDLLDHVVPAYYVLTTAEASSNLNRYDGVRFGYRTTGAADNLTDFYKQTRSEGFGIEVQRRIMLGTFVLSAGYYDAYYSKAQQVRRMLVNHVTRIFTEFDALLLPVSPTTAFPFGESSDDPTTMYLADIYTVFANLTGLPGIAVPLFKHSNNMPFGAQVMTAKADELTLLQLAELLITRYRTASAIV